MAVGYRASLSVRAFVAVLPIALVLSACGGTTERDSSRLAAMLDAEYGVNWIADEP